MRVLLVGASGRVGRMMLHHWAGSRTAPEITPQFRISRPGHGLIWEPLAGARPLMDRVEQCGGFDAMVMLGGVTPGPGKNLELNISLARACLAAAAQAGIGRVLLASSSAVYGAGDGRAWDEAAPCAPVNAYGMAKLRMEQACTPWRDTGGELCFLRIGNVAGADALLLNVAQSAKTTPVKIDIFADGTGPLRSYIGAGTLAQVLQTLCLHPAPLPDILNIAAPVPIAMEALAQAAGHPWQARSPAPGAHQKITLDCGALARLHMFAAADAQPDHMVRQWKETLAP
jgi:UDP-glucose 4-epimerase